MGWLSQAVRTQESTGNVDGTLANNSRGPGRVCIQYIGSALHGLRQRHVLGDARGVVNGLMNRPDDRPCAGAFLVEACRVDERVEAAPDTVADVAGELVPAVPQ